MASIRFLESGFYLDPAIGGLASLSGGATVFPWKGGTRGPYRDAPAGAIIFAFLVPKKRWGRRVRKIIRRFRRLATPLDWVLPSLFAFIVRSMSRVVAEIDAMIYPQEADEA